MAGEVRGIMILKSLIRTFFLGQAIETFMERVERTFRVQERKVYPRTLDGLLQAVRDNRFEIFITDSHQDEPFIVTTDTVADLMVVHDLDGAIRILKSVIHNFPEFE